jgi:hypothetical protein
MALTGHLSDLSLSELIEFFCNQRKSGRIEVLYPQGVGYFYLQTGSVVDAKIGVARGIDAVFYALTLPNAKFEFNAEEEAPDKTINQPWTQVVLEGLRRLDEGIPPVEAFPEGYVAEKTEAETAFENAERNRENVPAFLEYGEESFYKRKSFMAAAVVVAVLVTVAALGVPAGWYSRTKVEAAATQSVVTTPAPEPVVESASPSTSDASHSDNPNTGAPGEDAAALAARRQREKDRAKAREEKAANQPAPLPAATGPKRITVTVTYDESGRVTQASGGDASAIRIARQKRFPPGKAGSATVTIPIN